MKFIHFNDVDIRDESSWKSKAILSFDIDWASDDVLNDLVDFLTERHIESTFFVTHATPVLDRIRNNNLFELGIHPNFDPLFNRMSDAKSTEQTLEDLLKIVPEAKVVRSHSMVHSGRLLMLFQQFGLTHTSQFFTNRCKQVRPIEHINGLIEVPVYFADDGFIFEADQEKFKVTSSCDFLRSDSESVRVFNFHPIHIALNTHSFDFYNRTRDSHNDFEEVQRIRNRSFGAESMLIQLIKSL